MHTEIQICDVFGNSGADLLGGVVMSQDCCGVRVVLTSRGGGILAQFTRTERFCNFKADGWCLDFSDPRKSVSSSPTSQNALLLHDAFVLSYSNDFGSIAICKLTDLLVDGDIIMKFEAFRSCPV